MPSHQDIILTERLIEAGQILGITIRDHVVVTDTGCTSVREAHPRMQFAGYIAKAKGK